MGEYRSYRNTEKRYHNQVLFGKVASHHFDVRNNNVLGFIYGGILPIAYKIFKWVFGLYTFSTFLPYFELNFRSILALVIYFGVIIYKGHICSSWLDEYNQYYGTNEQYGVQF